jgi:hypothetical protein
MHLNDSNETVSFSPKQTLAIRFKKIPTSKEKQRDLKNLNRMRVSIVTLSEHNIWYKKLQIILYNFLERPRGTAAGLYQIIM